MKHGGKFGIALVGVLTTQQAVIAVPGDGQLNPYTAIVDRNVFNLKPAPVVDPNPPPPVAPAVKITLLGIVNGIGAKQVMFKAAVGTPPKDKSYIVSEGDREDDFEVLEINEQAGTVRIKNRSEEQTLSLEKDGLKPGSGPPVGPALPGLPGQKLPSPIPLPGQIGQPHAPQASALSAPGGNSVTTFGAGATTPNRPLRLSATSSGEAGLPGGTTLPLGNRRAAIQQTPQQPMDPAEQMIMMEVNRNLTADKVKQGLMPPIPPTPLTGQ